MVVRKIYHILHAKLGRKFFFEKLSRVPGIQEVNSFVAVSEIKATTALPLKI